MVKFNPKHNINKSIVVILLNTILLGQIAWAGETTSFAASRHSSIQSLLSPRVHISIVEIKDSFLQKLNSQSILDADNRQLTDSDLQRVLPMTRMGFIEKYTNCSDNQSRLSILKQKYRINHDIMLNESKEVIPLLQKNGKMYQINISQDMDTKEQEYYLIWAVLRIIINKQGFLVTWQVKNIAVSDYLSALSDLFCVHIIEKQIQKDFEDRYKDIAYSQPGSILKSNNFLMKVLSREVIMSAYPSYKSKLQGTSMDNIVDAVCKEMEPIYISDSSDNLDRLKNAFLKVHIVLAHDLNAYFKGNNIIYNEMAILKFLDILNVLEEVFSPNEELILQAI
ncbi:MAG: hypothetical protein GY853_07800 [PVC group bacterium]|nr:hypothetical protein [PVC group bacterium]